MQFVVDSTTFTLSVEQYSRSALLTELVRLNEGNQVHVSHVTVEDFQVLHGYLTQQILPSVNKVSILEYFEVHPTDSYELASLLERDLRMNMYSAEKKKCYKQPYYGLKQLDEETWNSIAFDRTVTGDMLFAGCSDAEKQSWEQIQEALLRLQPFLSVDGVMVAGGTLYSLLFGLPISDIDLFLYGCKQQQAEEKVQQLILALQGTEFLPTCQDEDSSEEHDWEDYALRTHVFRTANAITICTKPEIQVILRLYKTPSEVLHGFDIGSCSLGLTKDGLWMTHRWWYALHNGYMLQLAE